MPVRSRFRDPTSSWAINYKLYALVSLVTKVKMQVVDKLNSVLPLSPNAVGDKWSNRSSKPEEHEESHQQSVSKITLITLISLTIHRPEKHL